jgi:hypothetical protein
MMNLEITPTKKTFINDELVLVYQVQLVVHRVYDGVELLVEQYPESQYNDFVEHEMAL